MEAQTQLTSLLPLLDSSDLATVKQIKELVIEQLDSCKCKWIKDDIGNLPGTLH